MERRAKVELFEQIRREYEFRVGTVLGVAQVVEMLTAESNRHGRAVECVNRAIAAHVRWLRK